MAFTCPSCDMTSQHPEDEARGYCGACHAFTGELAALLAVEVTALLPGEAGLTVYAREEVAARRVLAETFHGVTPGLAGLPVVEDPALPLGDVRIVDCDGTILLRITDPLGGENRAATPTPG